MEPTLDAATIEMLAERLDRAEQKREPIGLLSLEYPAMTIDDGYAIQQAWVATLPRERLITPRVETELAFILKDDLGGPDCTLFDVLRATDYVVPALEIIDARVMRADPATGTTRKVFDTISDNAANAAIVLGGRPVKPDAVDLRWVSALVYRNGGIEESGVAAAVLDHPANGVAWLVNKLWVRGVSLKAGQIILGGSFTAPIDARPGDGFHVDYGALGSISVQFG